MLEKIDLEWIKSFVTFAESSGVEETATKLKLTQPAITQHLNKLESFLPKKLFIREGKRKVLTEFGQEFYKQSSLHLRNLDDLLRSSKFLSTEVKDVVLRFGVNNEIYYRICNRIQFEGQLEIFYYRSDEAIKRLLKREIDIAISREAPNSSDVIAVKWYSDTFALVYPKKWQNEVDSKGLETTLKNKNYILNMESFAQTEIALSHFKLQLKDLKTAYKLRDWLAFIKILESGQGWGILPTSFTIDSRVNTVPIHSKELPKTQFYILYHRTIKNYPGLKNLIKDILNSLN